MQNIFDRTPPAAQIAELAPHPHPLRLAEIPTDLENIYFVASF